MPDTHKRVFYHFVARLLQRTRVINKRVVYWIGSDVLRLESGSKYIDGCLNIAGSSWLADEVRQKGYACEVRLFPIEIPFRQPIPFPKAGSLAVLCYVPDAHHELHGSPEIQSVVERFSDVKFTIIGGHGTWWPDHPKNIRFLGWVDDSKEYIAAAHVMLRRTSHDSLSAFVREGLVAGRHVIFTYNCPGVIHVERGKISKLIAEIDKLRMSFNEQTLKLRQASREMTEWLSNTEEQLRALSSDYD
jgi:hypothetical protein